MSTSYDCDVFDTFITHNTWPESESSIFQGSCGTGTQIFHQQ